MRLLSTSDRVFREFLGQYKPPYAILSHRWGEEEVSYKDLRKSWPKDGAGLSKIVAFRDLAFHEGFDWCWVDTCCIDKKSSAELSEAINSMRLWYANASKCYAFLADASCDQPDSWMESDWFKRGWTLQELLYPPTVEFYDSQWRKIGTKRGLAPKITRISHIRKECLDQEYHRSRSSVAEKLSWAASRTTTRPEDMAYSLLGLLNVNMPLLYGEGATKAFRRLQIELLSFSDDESIFAWNSQLDGLDHEMKYPYWNTLLAKTVQAFVSSSYSWPFVYERQDDQGNPMSVRREGWIVTNKGLQITLPAKTWYENEGANHIAAMLFVKRRRDRGSPLWLLLKYDNGFGSWVRRRHPEQLMARDECKKTLGDNVKEGLEAKTICVNLAKDKYLEGS